MEEKNEIGVAITSGIVAVATITKAVNDIIQNTSTWNWVVILGVVSVISIFTLIFFIRKYLKKPNFKKIINENNKETVIGKIQTNFEEYLSHYSSEYKISLGLSDDERNARIEEVRKFIFKLSPDKELLEMGYKEKYYLILFALLIGAKRRIWAISTCNPKEWITDPLDPNYHNELEFLRLNFLVAEKDVLVERIFLVSKENFIEILKQDDNPVVKQIKKQGINYKTYVAFREEISHDLQAIIGDGFLAFDDDVVTEDEFFEGSIRGTIYLSVAKLTKYNRYFTEVRFNSHPLTEQYVNSLKNEK